MSVSGHRSAEQMRRDYDYVIETTVASQVVQKPSENESALFEELGSISHESWDCSGEIRVATRLTSSAYNLKFCMMMLLQNSRSRSRSWQRFVRHKPPSWEQWDNFSQSSSLRQSVNELKYSWMFFVTPLTVSTTRRASWVNCLQFCTIRKQNTFVFSSQTTISKQTHRWVAKSLCFLREKHDFHDDEGIQNWKRSFAGGNLWSRTKLSRMWSLLEL